MTSLRQFAALQPEKVSSLQSIRKALAQANKHALWISEEKALTDVLLKSMSCHMRSLGNMILLYRPTLGRVVN
jgi:hypothetical protein